MSRVNDDATGVKGSGFHPDETRIYNILVCVSAILLIFVNLRDSMGKYEAFLLFGEEEKLTSLLIEWTTALCAEFYFSWTIYRGITLKWKRLGLLILFCLLCIGYVLTSIVLFAFFFRLAGRRNELWFRPDSRIYSLQNFCLFCIGCHSSFPLFFCPTI